MKKTYIRIAKRLERLQKMGASFSSETAGIFGRQETARPGEVIGYLIRYPGELGLMAATVSLAHRLGLSIEIEHQLHYFEGRSEELRYKVQSSFERIEDCMALEDFYTEEHHRRFCLHDRMGNSWMIHEPSDIDMKISNIRWPLT